MWTCFTVVLDYILLLHLLRSFSLSEEIVICVNSSLSVFVGYPGRDRCPQWHLQECGREQVEDGQGSGQLRGSGVPPAQTGWHEPTLERPEGQISQHPVSKDLSNMYKWKCFFSYSSVCGHAAQIAVFCSFAALNSEKKKNILADGLDHGSSSSRSLPQFTVLINQWITHCRSFILTYQIRKQNYKRECSRTQDCKHWITLKPKLILKRSAFLSTLQKYMKHKSRVRLSPRPVYTVNSSIRCTLCLTHNISPLLLTGPFPALIKWFYSWWNMTHMS